MAQENTYPQGCLTDHEWTELVNLEYALTWNYSGNPKKDYDRHKFLSNKRWDSIQKIKL